MKRQQGGDDDNDSKACSNAMHPASLCSIQNTLPPKKQAYTTARKPVGHAVPVPHAGTAFFMALLTAAASVSATCRTSARRTSSKASLASFCTWKRSNTWRAWGARCCTTLMKGASRSVVTCVSAFVLSGPSSSKKPCSACSLLPSPPQTTRCARRQPEMAQRREILGASCRASLVEDHHPPRETHECYRRAIF